jgi:hypothetical protein
MTHEGTHSPGEVISSADIDRHHLLLEQVILQRPDAIRLNLRGQLKLEELSPSLQAIILQHIVTTSASDTFLGDGVTVDFVISAIANTASLMVFVNGDLQFPNNYSIVGTTVTFVVAPSNGDEIIMRYGTSAQVTLASLGDFVINHRTITEMYATPTAIFVYGVNKSTADVEVAKYEMVNLAQIGTAVDVTGGAPDSSIMVETVNAGITYVWAIGAAAGTNKIVKINTIDMSFVEIDVTVDVAAQIVSLETDGVFVYAFQKGGTVGPNTVVKIDAVTNVVTGFAVATGASSTGAIDMVIGPNGDLYIAIEDLNGTGSGEVRRYDLATGTLLATFNLAESPSNPTLPHPIKITATAQSVLVLDDTRQKFYIISMADTVTVLSPGTTHFPFVPTDILVDGVGDIWLSSADTVYESSIAGTVLNSAVMQAGFTIKDMAWGAGLLWVSYTDDVGVPDGNITKAFPGLPGP